MNPEPRIEGEYASRQVKAARRVLLDVHQVLRSFADAIVVVGGWVPDLLIQDPTTAHIGSIDVDLALDAEKLSDGRYAELLKLLLDTGRYKTGERNFQLLTMVDIDDGESIHVDVEFLAPMNVDLQKNRPKLVEDFRVLQFPECVVAFADPEDVELTGTMASGAKNTVHIRVASLPDFLLMKAHAIEKRDKPKDVYDFCYCLDEAPDAYAVVSASWRERREDPIVAEAIGFLTEKFHSVDHYGPQQLAIFHANGGPEEQEIWARRAYESVQALLKRLDVQPH
jgi:hypothetical protein